MQPDAIKKLKKLVPMLSSKHDGEVVATVAAINRILTADGSTIHDLTAAIGGPSIVYRDRVIIREKIVEKVVYRDRDEPETTPKKDPETAPRKVDHLTVLRDCQMILAGDLRPAEVEFVKSMDAKARRYRSKFTMTDRQIAWFMSLRAKVRERQK
ncbi:hypothetical protein C8J38_11024 [Rhizobium sp. PP-WC-2G-219]|nr:hypothetical protein C8J38_11024 [Rhizobium sp. PP-WC-2G-219]